MSISVSRTVVVRAHDALDEVGCRQLDRILSDLVESQGVSALIVDLSDVGEIDSALKAVLDRVQGSVGRLGGTIEVRTPPEPEPELLDIVNEIPTFVPIGPRVIESNASGGPDS